MVLDLVNATDVFISINKGTSSSSELQSWKSELSQSFQVGLFYLQPCNMLRSTFSIVAQCFVVELYWSYQALVQCDKDVLLRLVKCSPYNTKCAVCLRCDASYMVLEG